MMNPKVLLAVLGLGFLIWALYLFFPLFTMIFDFYGLPYWSLYVLLGVSVLGYVIDAIKRLSSLSA